MRLLWSLPKAAPAILRHFMGYAELAAQDLERTQRDFGARLVASIVLGACVFFVILSCCLLVLALTWDTPYRVVAVASMGVVFLLSAVIAGLYRSRAIGGRAVFLGTVRKEWAEDRVILEHILSEQD